MGLEGSQKKNMGWNLCLLFRFINTATGTIEDLEVKKWKAGGCQEA